MSNIGIIFMLVIFSLVTYTMQNQSIERSHNVRADQVVRNIDNLYNAQHAYASDLQKACLSGAYCETDPHATTPGVNCNLNTTPTTCATGCKWVNQCGPGDFFHTEAECNWSESTGTCSCGWLPAATDRASCEKRCKDAGIITVQITDLDTSEFNEYLPDWHGSTSYEIDVALTETNATGERDKRCGTKELSITALDIPANIARKVKTQVGATANMNPCKNKPGKQDCAGKDQTACSADTNCEWIENSIRVTYPKAVDLSMLSLFLPLTGSEGDKKPVKGDVTIEPTGQLGLDVAGQTHTDTLFVDTSAKIEDVLRVSTIVLEPYACVSTTECSGQTQTNCGGINGCTWDTAQTPAACTGTPDCSGTSYTKATCEQDGCYWDGAACKTCGEQFSAPGAKNACVNAPACKWEDV